MAAYYNENDPKAAAWLRELIRGGHIADGEVDERSILDVEPADIAGFRQCHFFAGIGGWSYALRLAGWPDDRPVWTGSPPCQPFSVAGLGKGAADERHLAPHFVELVRAGRPPVLFGEQVASSSILGRAAKTLRRALARKTEWAWLDDLQIQLERALYASAASDIPAASVGAPHLRQRTFFGAYDLRSAAGRSARRCVGGDDPWRNSLDAERVDFGTVAEPKRLERERGRAREAVHEPGTEQRTERLRDADRLEHGAGIGRQQRGAEPEGRGVVGGCSADRLAYADGGQPGEAGAVQPGGEHGLQPQGGGALGAADANNAGSQGRVERRDSAGERAIGPGGVADGQPAPGPTNGFWRDADWLLGTDGKWRPVEPGTQPLASRVPGRVGLLRGYGNAIVPQVAAEFVMAFMEANA